MEKLIVIGLCFIMACFSSCTAYVNHDDNLTMANMIRDGADPLAIKCAVKSSERPMCEILASKK